MGRVSRVASAPKPAKEDEVEHWKAQVKCQAGCPVATDAGRYVQLIAQGRDEEALRYTKEGERAAAAATQGE